MHIAPRLRLIPAITLWRAMNSARRPTCRASATRSTRSTVMTASAVSEETVAPAAPIALGDRATVPGDHRHMADALGAQARDDAIGVGAQLVGHHDDPAEMAVDSHQHVGLSGPVSAEHRGRGDLGRRYPGRT